MATFAPAYQEAAAAAAATAAERLPSRAHLIARCSELELTLRTALLEHATGPGHPEPQQCWCQLCQILRPAIGGAARPPRPGRPPADGKRNLQDLADFADRWKREHPP